MSKQYICKRGWKRHSKGEIITEWEWKKLAIESREQFFEEYNPQPEVIEPEVVEFASSLKKELEDRGVKAEVKPKKSHGSSEVDVTFKFDNVETKDNL
jgi:hypothetical protein